MEDNDHRVLTFSSRASSYRKSTASKLSKIKILGADYTYIYRCHYAQVNGSGTKYKGTYNSKLNLLEFSFKSVDMNDVKSIEFTIK